MVNTSKRDAEHSPAIPVAAMAVILALSGILVGIINGNLRLPEPQPYVAESASEDSVADLSSVNEAAAASVLEVGENAEQKAQETASAAKHQMELEEEQKKREAEEKASDEKAEQERKAQEETEVTAQEDNEEPKVETDVEEPVEEEQTQRAPRYREYIITEETTTTTYNVSAGDETRAGTQTSAPVAQTSANSWNGSKLTRSGGVNYGPTGKETYYNLPMGGVVSIMRGLGYSEADHPYWVRSDGCKMLGDYIMVAADLNTFPRGSLVECSLGTAIVCDTGSFIYTDEGATWLDIAVDW